MRVNTDKCCSHDKPFKREFCEGELVYVPPMNNIVGDERNPPCFAGLAKRNSEVKKI
jgi:hypothetical protein